MALCGPGVERGLAGSRTMDHAAPRLGAMADRDPTEILRPASQPRYEHEVHWDVRIPVRDGLELSANLWLPSHPAAPRSAFPSSSR